jgi:predicted S18 family serine protease
MPTPRTPRTPKLTALDVRVAELRTEISRFEALAVKAESGDRPDLKAAVAAETRASALRKELANILAEQEAAGVRDPVKRAGSLARRAAADGSWVAAQKLFADEQELAEAARKLKELEDAKQRKGQGEEDLVETFAELAPRIPEGPLKQRLREALG